MKYLTFVFLMLVANLTFGQGVWGASNCPDEEVVGYEFSGDTTFLTVVFYRWVQVYENAALFFECDKDVRKDVYVKGELVGSVKGRVVPKQVIPERFEFDDGIEFISHNIEIVETDSILYFNINGSDDILIWDAKESVFREIEEEKVKKQ
jgi:hypothetical protein